MEAFIELAPPQIEPGIYEVAYISHMTWYYLNRQPKLRVDFKIVSMGPYLGLIFSRFYNIKKIVGKPGRNGRFNAGWSTDFAREFARVIDMPKRSDRFSMSKLKNFILEVEIADVTKDRNLCDLHESSRYSVIKRIMRRKNL